MLNKIVTNKQVTRNISEFFLENQHYIQAVELFKFIENTEENNLELFEKIGYCYQRIGDYKNALDYYKKAELLEANKIWITKKIALCYRYLNENNKALEYYKAAEKLEPENLYIQAYIGHSLMRLKKYDEALKYYFKVEYLAPSNDKIQRPIAWISLILGKFETAINYYSKIPDINKNVIDYTHLGHSYWCNNNLKDAITSYERAFKLAKKSSEFFDAFKDDIEILQKNGIKTIDIGLMKDYIIKLD